MYPISEQGFSMDWGIDGQFLWIEMRVPRSFLTQFAAPGDILAQFLEAAQSRGLDIGGTDSLRTSINQWGAHIRWRGDHTGEAAQIMTAMKKELEA